MICLKCQKEETTKDFPVCASCIATFQAKLALQELKRRHPSEEWIWEGVD